MTYKYGINDLQMQITDSCLLSVVLSAFLLFPFAGHKAKFVVKRFAVFAYQRLFQESIDRNAQTLAFFGGFEAERDALVVERVIIAAALDADGVDWHEMGF